MAKVLGLSFFYHDSAAALISGGEIVAAASEERFTREKHTSVFPKQAIEFCLEQAGLNSLNEIDAIVFYEKPVVKLLRQIEGVTETWPRSLFSFTRQFPGFLKSKLDIRDVIAKELPGYKNEVLFSEHHLSHAASAFYCSPFKDAAILTIDGVGEWETTTIGHGNEQKIEILQSLHFPHSVGLLYAALTSYLGFKVNDGEWKVMGLAPYGKPRLVEAFQKLIQTRADGSFALDMDYFSHHFSSRTPTVDAKWKNLFGFPRRLPDEELDSRHADLARSGQTVVEQLILGLAREAKRVSGSDNLVIAGGVGLNGVANSKIEKEGIFKNVWIHPAPGDDGAALGAGLLAAREIYGEKRSIPFEQVYLGPDFTDREIESFLSSHGIQAERVCRDELIELTAEMVASGKVVGWFQNRMEFGPRSLGARSIFADARSASMKTIINEKIKYREPFRPFAPVCILEDASEFFAIEPGEQFPFMIKVVPVRENKKALIPAVTHEDGSARLQTIARHVNPLLYDLLQEFKLKTGIGMMVNTSFNIRGEPIVCSPKDAYRCFLNTGLDALILGSFIITEKPRSQNRTIQGYALSDALEKTPRHLSLNDHQKTQDKVLSFYKMLPFNVYSNAIDTANELTKKSPLKTYPSLRNHLQKLPKTARILDVGCGTGWFLNACSHYHGLSGVGLDLNAVVLKQAKSVARLIPNANGNDFLEMSLFDYQSGATFDVVNSLGVLHHTPDCHGAIRRLLGWVKPGGYLHLGLYHSHGRKPFLTHFETLRKQGKSDEELFQEFQRLNPEKNDDVHLFSWFRDQVLHPHETQHSYDEIEALLVRENFVIDATSINRFKKMPARDELVSLEKKYRAISERSLHREHRYFPGFFVVLARKKEGTV